MNKRTKRTILLGVCLSPFVLGISTVNAVKGLSTGPALYYDMEEKAAEWEGYANQYGSDPETVQSIADTLAPLKNSICTTAGLEEREGLVTGSRGAGALSAALVSACTGLTALDSSLEENRNRSSARRDQIISLLDQLLEVPEQKDLSIFKRQDRFEEIAAALKAVLSAGNPTNFRSTIRAQVAILANSVAELETKEGAFGARQRAAVSELKKQLNEAKAIVSEFLETGATVSSVQEPDALLSSEEAIARWWPRLLPQILAAVGVDLAILWMAAFLSVGRVTLRELRDELA